MTTPHAVTPVAALPNLAIEIDAQIARGLYSNVMLVARTPTELTLDFAYAMPHDRVVVQARIILVPHTARELANLLLAQLDPSPAER
ncbi:MAG TPA: DUF3467 domain-containing protein [Kofleriaceae bacterium]|nr:DUF3467 domain-containing protein [Kofleriaceae bacterium]